MAFVGPAFPPTDPMHIDQYLRKALFEYGRVVGISPFTGGDLKGKQLLYRNEVARNPPASFGIFGCLCRGWR